MDEPESDHKPKPVDNDAANADASAPGDEKPKAKLTPEEQMAAFEKAMKEEDWGHQPC
jgi:hypothetical protein